MLTDVPLVGSRLRQYAMAGLAAALLASIGTAGYLALQLERERTAHQATHTRHAEQHTEAARLTIAAVNAARTEGNRRVESHARIAERAVARAAALDRAAAVDRAADDERLRHASRAATARACAGAADPAAAASSSAAGAARDLQADVFAEMGAAGRALAIEAGRRGIAGDACAGSYDALTTRQP